MGWGGRATPVRVGWWGLVCNAACWQAHAEPLDLPTIQRPPLSVAMQNSPLELAQLASKSDSLGEAMLSHLEECRLLPVLCSLGSAAQETEVGNVGMRDMGANTPSAPSSVRITSELQATLTCARLAPPASEAASEDAPSMPPQVQLPLGGAADAVLLARYLASRGRPLPLLVTQSLWDLRSVAPERLPETIGEVALAL